MVAWIRNFINKLKRFGVERIVCSTFLFVFPIVLILVYVFLGLQPGNSSRGAITVVDALEKLPTQWTFYAIIAALVVEYLVWRWRMFASLRKELQTKAEEETKNKDGLTGRDWWVVQGLRKRGLALRTRADLILGSAFALLFAGIYLVIFVLPQILEIDRALIAERQFREQFGRALECLVQGQCWLKILEKSPRDVRRLLFSADDNIEELSVDDNIDARAFEEVSVSTTKDGGATWSRLNLKLKDTELVTIAGLSADGKTGLIGGSRGSVFMTTDGRATWSRPNLRLEGGEWVHAVVLSADGRIGLIGGDEGSVFMTTDRGKTWSRLNLKLEGGEWVHVAAFSADGRTGLIRSDEGSVFVRKNYRNMEGWNVWSIAEIRNKMEDDEILRNSKIFRDISAFVVDAIMSRGDREDGGARNASSVQRSLSRGDGEDGGPSRAGGDQRSMAGGDGEDDGAQKADGGRQFWRSSIDENLTVRRIVTMAVLFFLVQILVRLHQYNLRLAAFWESRADAVLLAQSFADRNAHRFDDLVGALAPDAYDFKSPPRSPFDWIRPRREP